MNLYLQCYPFYNHRMHQEYYLREYFNDKDSTIKNLIIDYSCGDVFHQMCQVLIKDGFDCKLSFLIVH